MKEINEKLMYLFILSIWSFIFILWWIISIKNDMSSIRNKNIEMKRTIMELNNDYKEKMTLKEKIRDNEIKLRIKKTLVWN